MKKWLLSGFNLIKRKKVSQSKQMISLSKEQINDLTENLVSSVHPVSNIRFVRPAIPKNESEIERDYREKYEKLQIWNHKYWEENNAAFLRGKQDYAQLIKTHQELQPKNQELFHPFYKDFLNLYKPYHISYNKEWYKRNFQLLGPAIKVFFWRIYTRKSYFKSK